MSDNTNTNEWTLSLSTFLVRWRWLLMLVSLFIVGAFAGGGRYINFAADYEVWFSRDNPQLQDFLTLQNTYDKSDNILILLAPKQGEVFTRTTLSSIEWLTQQAWQTPYSTRVDSVTNFQHTAAENDDLVVGDLVRGADNLTDDELQSIRSIALAEPLLVHRLISEDAKVSAVAITINLPKNAPEGSPTVTAYVRDLVTRMNVRDPDLEMHLTGLVAMDNAFMEASQQDMGTLTLAMFALILFGLVALLRSVTGTISILVIIVLAIMATMGFSGWRGILLTPVSAGAPTIVMTIVVANAVHLLVTLMQEMRAGSSKREALVESLRVNVQPIFLATLTTIIGFLSMRFSDIPPFHHLGDMVAVGVSVAFILSVAFLPGLLMLFPIRVKVKLDHQNRHLAGLSRFVIRRHNPLLWGFSGLTLVLVSCIPLSVINDHIWEYFDTSVAFRVDTDYASDHLTGPYYLEYSLSSGVPGGVNAPAFLKTIDVFKQWLNGQPEVVHVNTLSDTMKRLNKNLHADDADWYRLPEDQELAAQYLLLYEMSLPYGLDLNNQVNLDKSDTRVVVSLHNLSSTEMIAFAQRTQTWLNEQAAGIEFTASSPMFMFSHISKRTVRQMTSGVGFALGLISLILIVALRSVRVGLLSLIPNLAPPAMAFGIWGLLVGEVGFALAVGIGMTIGIIVDDTVHFLSKYLRARREKGLSAEQAVEYAFSNVGVALVITTVVLVGGFSILMLSTFKLNNELGAITALTISIALILDLFLLPALLMKFDKRDYAVVNDKTDINQRISLEEA